MFRIEIVYNAVLADLISQPVFRPTLQARTYHSQRELVERGKPTLLPHQRAAVESILGEIELEQWYMRKAPALRFRARVKCETPSMAHRAKKQKKRENWPINSPKTNRLQSVTGQPISALASAYFRPAISGRITIHGHNQ